VPGNYGISFLIFCGHAIEYPERTGNIRAFDKKDFLFAINPVQDDTQGYAACFRDMVKEYLPVVSHKDPYFIDSSGTAISGVICLKLCSCFQLNTIVFGYFSGLPVWHIRFYFSKRKQKNYT
jgi:hypothetical protein